MIILAPWLGVCLVRQATWSILLDWHADREIDGLQELRGDERRDNVTQNTPHKVDVVMDNM